MRHPAPIIILFVVLSWLAFYGSLQLAMDLYALFS